MSGRLNLHSRRIENSSPPPEEKNESPPHPNNQSRLAMCPFSENKNRLGSGVTTPSMPTLGSSQHGGVPPPPEKGPPIQQGWDKLPSSTRWLDVELPPCIQLSGAGRAALFPGGPAPAGLVGGRLSSSNHRVDGSLSHP